eukprot:GHVS01104626.1.p2 GENE.GHVS01104626.1~~GHVS01104626.1.p2  ORF type:complete len:109 (-),score=3.38 GHVS01104626.1:818-1144(-)
MELRALTPSKDSAQNYGPLVAYKQRSSIILPPMIMISIALTRKSPLINPCNMRSLTPAKNKQGNVERQTVTIVRTAPCCSPNARGGVEAFISTVQERDQLWRVLSDAG